MKVDLWLYAMMGMASASAVVPRKAQDGYDVEPKDDYSDDYKPEPYDPEPTPYEPKDDYEPEPYEPKDDYKPEPTPYKPEPYKPEPPKDDYKPEPYEPEPTPYEPEPYKPEPPKDDYKPEPYKPEPPKDDYKPEPYKPEPPKDDYKPEPYKPEPPKDDYKPEPYKPEPPKYDAKPEPYKPEPDYKDEYSPDYPTKDEYGSEYPKDKYPKEWKPKTHHPEFFSLKVDEKKGGEFDGFAIRLEKGIVIATPYNKWWDPKLPIFFVDDDTQAYTVSKKPLQLYVDAVTGALRYAPVGWLPPNSIAISFYKIGNNPLGKVGPSPAYFAWPSTEGRTNLNNVGTWWLCPLSGTGQYQVFISDVNFGKSQQGGVWKDQCQKESLAAVNANPWKSSGY